VSRRIIPQESRWAEFVEAIETFRFEDINDHLRPGVDYVVLHGSGGKDAYQIEALKPHPGLRHYVFAGSRHNVAREIKQRGLLRPLIEAALRDDPAVLDQVVRQAGAVSREEAGSVLEHLEARRTARRTQSGLSRS
jgi:hypothetical protein